MADSQKLFCGMDDAAAENILDVESFLNLLDHSLAGIFYIKHYNASFLE